MSTPHTLPLIDEYTLYLLNFLILGLSNSSANSWFKIASLSISPTADFLLKTF